MGADGVADAAVNLALERAVIHIDPLASSIASIIEVVRRCGYNVGTETRSFRVEGLANAEVARSLDKALQAVHGVLAVEINSAREQVKVTSVSLMAPYRVLAAAASDVGCRLVAESNDDVRGEHLHRQAVGERRAVLAAAVLTMPFIVQMASMFFLGEDGRGLHMPPWLELTLAMPLQFVLGLRFYRGAFNSLRGGGANMEVLVVLGTSAAFAYSVGLMLTLGEAARGQLYFEASAVIITLVLIGKHLEARAKKGAAAAIQELMALRPAVARVRLPDGELEERPCAELKLGDLFVCRPGDQVAADGVIVRGEAEIDESLITGESVPVAKGPGDPVTAGSINVDGFIDIEAKAVDEDSVLAKMIRLVERAQVSKSAVQRLVDRVSAIFVPTVIAIAAVTFCGWLIAGAGLEKAFVCAAATLVIACPCALGLATPTAIVAGSGAAARAGILIRDISVLERVYRLSHVLFDKTGTLTEGKPVVAEMSLALGVEVDEAFRTAASLQQGSEHPIALAFREEANKRQLKLAQVEHFKSIASRGIEGDVEGVRYLLGNERLFQDKELVEPAPETQFDDFPGSPGKLNRQQGASAQGGAKVWLGVRSGNGVALLARFALVDRLRPTAKAAVEQLKQLGIKPLLASGDAASVTRRVGDELGIDQAYGDVRPEDKAALIAELQAGGAEVGMVGDGVNDAPALAGATIGIAMGSGVDVAIETAAITLIAPDPRLVASAIDVSRRTFRKIKQNLFWAFAYNMVGLPLAALGQLSPSLAGAAMAFSSLSVVMNSLRLRSWKPNLPPLQGSSAEPLGNL